MRRSERIRLQAAERELARLRSHLEFIAVRCRGTAPGLASQALHSDVWPSWPRRERDKGHG